MTATSPRPNPALLAGGAVVALAIAVAALASWLAPHDPDTADPARGLDALGLPVGPTRDFPLGADALGRCELSRLLHGGRVSLLVAFVATAIAVSVGVAVGLAAARAHATRPWLDALLMRFVDVLLAFPFLLVVMAVNKAVARPGVWVLLVVLGLLSWTGMSRVVRAKALQLEALPFVEASRALGASPSRVVLRHVLPHLVPLVLVVATSGFGDMILAESALSFLGVGVLPPTSSWGSMLREGVAMARVAPRLLLLPGGAIVAVVVGVNLLGEGVRRALEPRR